MPIFSEYIQEDAHSLCNECNECLGKGSAKGLCKSCYNKDWKKNNPGSVKTLAKKYRENNKDKVHKIGRDWYLENRDRKLAQSRETYLRNKSHIRARQSEWDKNNRESKRSSWKKWNAAKRGGTGSFSSDDWQETLSVFCFKCAYCGNEENLTQDHVVPLSKGGTHEKSNVVPACKSCNSRKGDKTISGWIRGITRSSRGTLNLQ